MPDPTDQDGTRPITNNFNGPVNLTQGRNAGGNTAREDNDDRSRRRREPNYDYDPYRWRPGQTIAVFGVILLIIGGLVAWGNGIGCIDACARVAEKNADTGATAAIGRVANDSGKIDADKQVALAKIEADRAVETRRADRDEKIAAVNAEARKVEAQNKAPVIAAPVYAPAPPVVVAKTGPAVYARTATVTGCGKDFCGQVGDVCKPGFHLVEAPGRSASGYLCVPNR